jgi:hypothetical protein
MLEYHGYSPDLASGDFICFQCSGRILAAEDGGDVGTVVTRWLMTQDTDINRK